jgi:UPF0755 protein
MHHAGVGVAGPVGRSADRPMGRRPGGPPPPSPLGFDDGYPDEPEDDVIYLADEPGFFRRAGRVIAFFVLLVIVLFGLGGYWVYSQINPTPSTDELTVVVPSDAGLNAIGDVLEQQGVVTSSAVFRYYARIKGIGPIRPGEYDKLHRAEPMDKVIERLEGGPAPVRFTDLPLPEGLWLTETAARMKEKFPQMEDGELAAALTSVRSSYQPANQPLDGFLFPATYRVTEKSYGDERALVEQMVHKFDETAAQVGLGDTSQLKGVAGNQTLTPYDVLKVAALVEAEAKVPEDRPRIARVIYNRMKQNMRLEIDATVPFALGQRKPPTGADLQVDSPFNLRRHAGLTPTPINSPGADSLRAALNPSTEPNADRWLYYVLVDKDGHHSFSQTLEDHNRKVAEARRAGIL